MRIPSRTVLLLLMAASISACGVPREAARIAASRASLEIPKDDAEVRAALAQQADAWTQFAGMMLQHSQFGGIQGVNPAFTKLVVQTAALARRERDLIAAQQDDPPNNREALEKLQRLWQAADRYLNP